MQTTNASIQDDPSAHEMVVGKLRVGISIKNLTKQYSNASFITAII